ncbi:DUF1493 family protein [Botryobacter ruber]|uniref:DUF1493 family protein n=1 Tax=Botryobacter ruber TaxID=2171629 RepID=UPI000E0A924D|nr:DUF1493 family protein [Botryobacter ruber]
MVSSEDVLKFVAKYSPYKDVNEDSDIYADLDLVGDDFHEFIDAYAPNFNVDMSDYLWYFHGDEEGTNFGALFFKPPYMMVKRIPVTPKLLMTFANNKKWEIAYPPHDVPETRPDLKFNKVLSLITFIVFLLLFIVLKFIK